MTHAFAKTDRCLLCGCDLVDAGQPCTPLGPEFALPPEPPCELTRALAQVNAVLERYTALRIALTDALFPPDRMATDVERAEQQFAPPKITPDFITGAEWMRAQAVAYLDRQSGVLLRAEQDCMDAARRLVLVAQKQEAVMHAEQIAAMQVQP